jgi:hypothetical protein
MVIVPEKQDNCRTFLCAAKGLKIPPQELPIARRVSLAQGTHGDSAKAFKIR